MSADMGFAQLAPVHLVANRRRNSRELVTLVGGQITALATDGWWIPPVARQTSPPSGRARARWASRRCFARHQTGRRVVGENNDNCAGSANDPIDRPRTDVKSNTARMKPCRRNEIRSGP